MQQNRVEARLTVFLLVLLFSCPAVLASEQPYLSGEAKWRNPRITLSLSRSIPSSGNIQGDVAQVVRRSLRAWSNPTTIIFDVIESDVESVSPKGNKGDGISLLTAGVTSENLKLFPRQAASPAAVTRVFRDGLGYITEADIALNPFVRFSTDGSFGTFDLQDTLTHEIGHLLGLVHLPVWGSVMYERAPRSLGPALFRGSRDELAQVDSSSIKGLYGPRTEDVQCCGAVVGRVFGSSAGMRVLVWMEEADTGRLVAATVPAKDGSYRLDGVSEGDFILFASAESPSDDFGSGSSKIVVAVADTAKKNFDLRPSRSGVRVQLLGTSIQLAALPLDLSSISQGLFLGVRGTTESITHVDISGGEVAFEPSLGNPPPFSSVKVVGFLLTVRPDLAKGEYTLIITASTGVKQYLVGSLVNR